MIQPLDSKLFISPVKGESKTESGFLIPADIVETTNRGKVVAVGPQVKDVLAGAEVIYLGYPVIMPIDGQDVAVIDREDLVGIEVE